MKKPHLKEDILYDSIYVKVPEQATLTIVSENRTMVSGVGSRGELTKGKYREISGVIAMFRILTGVLQNLMNLKCMYSVYSW